MSLQLCCIGHTAHSKRKTVMDPTQAPNVTATASGGIPGELRDPLADPLEGIQDVSEINLEMQDAAQNLSLEARSGAFSTSRFLVASDIRTSLAPAPEVQVPRALFSSLSSSMSKVRSAMTSARRDSNQTPRFRGFSREHTSEETEQSSPFIEEPSQVPSGFTGTAPSLSITKKRKASATLLGLVFVEEPQAICGAPIGSSGRFCLLEKFVCDTDSHRRKGSELRALPLSCWVIVSESPSKPSAYYSPYVTKEDMEKNTHFQTLLSEKKWSCLSGPEF